MTYSRAIQHRPQSRHLAISRSLAMRSGGVAASATASVLSRLCVSFLHDFTSNPVARFAMPKLGRAEVNKTLKNYRGRRFKIAHLARVDLSPNQPSTPSMGRVW